MLRVVAELLGGGGVAKEKGEGGEDVVARRRKGRRGGEVLGHVGFGGGGSGHCFFSEVRFLALKRVLRV